MSATHSTTTVPTDPEASFYALGPEQVLQAVESLAFPCSGHLLALNSYENRVYRIGVETGDTVVAKFYRPGRWSDTQILEEHTFTEELAALDIPVVPPMTIAGRSLHRFQSYRFSLYPCIAGRAPNLEDPGHLAQLGRFIGRMHALGASADFKYRPALDVAHFGDDSYEYLLDHGFIPPELEAAYESVAEAALDRVDECFDMVRPHYIRLHGDGHQGNILWSDSTPVFLDFDDARMGPAIQDLWMFLSGDRNRMLASLDTLLTAYSQFYDFDARELLLIEPLRTLRLMHYAAWLARRWGDPAFQRTFPWFNRQQYWEEHILTLKEQLAAMQDEPLRWQ